MLVRFQEQVQQDESDKEKTQEVLSEVQHAMDVSKKSVLDRETERLVLEQDEEYENEQEPNNQWKRKIIIYNSI